MYRTIVNDIFVQLCFLDCVHVQTVAKRHSRLDSRTRHYTAADTPPGASRPLRSAQVLCCNLPAAEGTGNAFPNKVKRNGRKKKCKFALSVACGAGD